MLSPRDSAWGGRGEEVGLAGEPCGGRSARPVVLSQGQGRMEGSVPFDLTIEPVIFTLLVLSNLCDYGEKKQVPSFFHLRHSPFSSRPVPFQHALFREHSVQGLPVQDGPAGAAGVKRSSAKQRCGCSRVSSDPVALDMF